MEPIKTSVGNTRRISRGPNKGMVAVLSGPHRGVVGKLLRWVDHGHNALVQPKEEK